MTPIKSVTAATAEDLGKVSGRGRKPNPLFEAIKNLLDKDQAAKVDIELAGKETEHKFRNSLFASLKRRGVEHPSISKIEPEGGEGHITLIVQSKRKESE